MEGHALFEEGAYYELVLRDGSRYNGEFTVVTSDTGRFLGVLAEDPMRADADGNVIEGDIFAGKYLWPWHEVVRLSVCGGMRGL